MVAEKSRHFLARSTTIRRYVAAAKALRKLAVESIRPWKEEKLSQRQSKKWYRVTCA